MNLNFLTKLELKRKWPFNILEGKPTYTQGCVNEGRKAKLPMGIRKPTYQLPPTDDYASWCQYHIERKKATHETSKTEHGSALPFYHAAGLRISNGDSCAEGGW